MIFSAIVNAVAVCIIAYYTFRSYRLQKESRDFYQAIVIATIMSGNSDPKHVKAGIEEFKKYYIGSTKIF